MSHQTCLCGHHSADHHRIHYSMFPCLRCPCRDFSEDRDDDTAADINYLLGRSTQS